MSFPLGFFSCSQHGDTVTLHLPGSHSIGTVYNYGTTAEQPFDHWYQVPAGGSDIDPDQVVLHVHPANTAIGLAVIQPGAGTTIVVNSTDDADDGQPDNGHTTLREAINRANFLPRARHSRVQHPGPGPAHDPTHILAQPTQPRLDPSEPAADHRSDRDRWLHTTRSMPATDTTPATLMIELDGSLAGGADGLWILSGNSLVRGLVINRFATDQYGWRGGTQISIRQEYGGLVPGNNVIEGNYIGTDVTGTTTYYAVDPNYVVGPTVRSTGWVLLQQHDWWDYAGGQERDRRAVFLRCGHLCVLGQDPPSNRQSRAGQLHWHGRDRHDGLGKRKRYRHQRSRGNGHRWHGSGSGKRHFRQSTGTVSRSVIGPSTHLVRQCKGISSVSM